MREPSHACITCMQVVRILERLRRQQLVKDVKAFYVRHRLRLSAHTADGAAEAAAATDGASAGDLPRQRSIALSPHAGAHHACAPCMAAHRRVPRPLRCSGRKRMHVERRGNACGCAAGALERTHSDAAEALLAHVTQEAMEAGEAVGSAPDADAGAPQPAAAPTQQPAVADAPMHGAPCSSMLHMHAHPWHLRAARPVTAHARSCRSLRVQTHAVHAHDMCAAAGAGLGGPAAAPLYAHPAALAPGVVAPLAWPPGAAPWPQVALYAAAGAGVYSGYQRVPLAAVPSMLACDLQPQAPQPTRSHTAPSAAASTADHATKPLTAVPPAPLGSMDAMDTSAAAAGDEEAQSQPLDAPGAAAMDATDTVRDADADARLAIPVSRFAPSAATPAHLQCVANGTWLDGMAPHVGFLPPAKVRLGPPALPSAWQLPSAHLCAAHPECAAACVMRACTCGHEQHASAGAACRCCL
jgi:hypothetical protein